MDEEADNIHSMEHLLQENHEWGSTAVVAAAAAWCCCFAVSHATTRMCQAIRSSLALLLFHVPVYRRGNGF